MFDPSDAAISRDSVLNPLLQGKFTPLRLYPTHSDTPLCSRTDNILDYNLNKFYFPNFDILLNSMSVYYSSYCRIMSVHLHLKVNTLTSGQCKKPTTIGRSGNATTHEMQHRFRCCRLITIVYHECRSHGF
jgi:hypothetical protein